MDSKILIIAGMHRSGTSVLSQWLFQCGLQLGDRLLGPAIGNTEGHFEDLDFLEYHQETLEAFYSGKPANDHSSLHTVPVQPDLAARAGYVHQPVSTLSVYQKEKLRSVIRFKAALQQEWGWKEPRTCLFLDHYQSLIPEAYYLIIIRDFRETVSSLIQRDLKELDKYYLSKSWMSRQNWARRKRRLRATAMYHATAEFYLRVWVAYNQAILTAMETLPAHQFVVTDHGHLAEQHSEIFDTLVSKWGFSLRQVDFNQIYKKSLLSEVTDIDPFVKDKTLLQKAAKIESEIRSYL